MITRLINNTDMEVPRIDEMQIPLPISCWGMVLKLSLETQPVFVFISATDLPHSGDSSSVAYLFGAKYPLDNALIGGTPQPSQDAGFFLRFYVVVKENDLEDRLWTLAQLSSVTFSDQPDGKDYIHVKDLVEDDKPVVDQFPTWKKTEAIWPTVHGKPMTFLSQSDLHNTESNKKYLTVNLCFFLFYSISDGQLRFKATTQEKNFQTARGHYAAEAKRLTKKP